MFDINEIRFLDELISEYLKYHNDLPLAKRNGILKLVNKLLDIRNALQDNEKRELEEDKQQLKRIVK